MMEFPSEAHKEPNCNIETNKHWSIMARGGQSKNDITEIDDLFRLTTSDWVCNRKSQARTETILNNEWFNAGLKPATKVSVQGGSTQMAPVHVKRHVCWPCASHDTCASVFRYEAMMKTKDPAFTSLLDSVRCR